MDKKNKCLKFLLVFTSAILCSSSPLYALSLGGSNSQISDIEIEQIEQSLVDVGVSSDNIDYLLEKVTSGEILDSMNPIYDDIEPINVINTFEEYIEEYIYPDGSIKVVSIAKTSTSASITTGSYSSGTYWYSHNGASVSVTYGILTMQFKANFQGGNGFGQIDSVYDFTIITVGGTFSDQSLTIDIKNATSSTPAQATLFCIAQLYGGAAQSTCYLRLYVPYAAGAYAKFTF